MFGFSGPCYSVDTACSSSLVSTHIASSTLQQGESESSMSAGVQHLLVPQPFVVLMTSNMLSPDGRCKTLDSSANGYVRAESCGVLALRTGVRDWCLVVIRGSSANQDGRSSSLTAPHGPSQQSVLHSSLRCSSLRPEQYEQHEMHGTGTSLGDPIEVGAACAVLLKPSVSRGPLRLSAAKIAHGHAEAGAGIVGTLQGLAGATHTHIPSLTNLRTVNPYVADTLGPLNLALTPRLMAAGASLLLEQDLSSGVSAFAFQGSNSHLILGTTSSSSCVPPQQVLPLAMRHLWVAPEPYRMLRNVGCAESEITMEVVYTGVTLGYLRDCCVGNRVLLPATALMEVLTTMAFSTLDEGYSSSALATTALSFNIPVGLPGCQDAAECIIQCTISKLTAACQVKPAKELDDTAYASSNISMLAIRRALLLWDGQMPAAQMSVCAQETLMQTAMQVSCCAHITKVWGVSMSAFGFVGHGLGHKATTGYRVHPAAMASCFQLDYVSKRNGRERTLRGSTSVPGALGSFVVLGRASNLRECASTQASCSGNSNGAELTCSTLKAAIESPAMASVGNLQMRALSHVATANRPSSGPGIRILYVCARQVTAAPTREAVCTMQHTHSNALQRPLPSTAESVRVCVQGVRLQYMDAWSNSNHVPSAVFQCTQLLEVIQCAPQVGIFKVLLQSVGASPVGSCAPVKVRTAPSAVGKNANHGLLRAFASECPMNGACVTDVRVESIITGKRRMYENAVGLLEVQRLLHSTLPVWHMAELSRKGLYTLSGGLGSLGLLLASWLVSCEAAPVCLLGRSGRASLDTGMLLKVFHGHAVISAVRCNLSCREEVWGLVPTHRCLRGFVHAGGVLQDAVIANMSLGRMRGAFAPKVDGMWNMEVHLMAAPVSTVVLFSSIASFLGGVGQANYTAANAALDAVATVRQSHGVVGGSVQWGTWAGSGMALREASTMRRAEKLGLGVVMPDVGLAVTAAFMRSSAEGAVGAEPLQVALASAIEWPTFLAQVVDPGVYNAHAAPHAFVTNTSPCTRRKRSRRKDLSVPHPSLSRS